MYSFFFFNDTATTEIYTLSLHDALPIYVPGEETFKVLDESRISKDQAWALAYVQQKVMSKLMRTGVEFALNSAVLDRKSTRLNSSHVRISYAVFCLKKKNTVA